MPDELTLITPVNDNFRRDVEVYDETLLDPNESDALIQGEWVAYNSGGKKVVRAVAGDRGAMQIFSQKGDMAAQALKKVAVLQLHEYEAETTVFDDAYAAGGIAVGDPITVDTITLDTVAAIFTGIRKADTSGDVIYGHVTRVPWENNGKLRFQKSLTGAALP